VFLKFFKHQAIKMPTFVYSYDLDLTLNFRLLNSGQIRNLP
jgi:hypothetical protein